MSNMNYFYQTLYRNKTNKHLVPYCSLKKTIYESSQNN